VSISNARKELSCMLVHDLLNRISIIMGNCDLASQNTPANSENAKHISIIRENARMMALELSNHMDELSEQFRTTKASPGGQTPRSDGPFAMFKKP
jgi:hypothetical protein